MSLSRCKHICTVSRRHRAAATHKIHSLGEMQSNLQQIIQMRGDVEHNSKKYLNRARLPPNHLISIEILKSLPSFYFSSTEAKGD